MAQVNVYVPDLLKAELERADFPLSRVASRAWKRELALQRRREEEAAWEKEKTTIYVVGTSPLILARMRQLSELVCFHV